MSTNSSAVDMSTHSLQSRCSNVTLGLEVIHAFTGARLLLLLPSSIFILHLGLQQWRRQRRVKPQSHFDVFTCHLAVVELVWTLGTLLFYVAVRLPALRWAGLYLLSIMFVGETLFHVLTCLDRYLAVVHPVPYKRLNDSHGVTVRNASASLAWLFSFLWCHLTMAYYPDLPIIQFFCFLVSSLVVISFCSFSVLHALIRPGPGGGDGDGDRKHVDLMKQRAFHTVMAITAVLCLWFVVFLVATSLRESKALSHRVSCVLHKFMHWFSLPSSVVLQLLYLHKKDKLACSCWRTASKNCLC